MQKDGEFHRPYKRILPDVISSEVALLRALSIANDLYLALDRLGYRVHIAPAGEDHHRIQVQEQEVQLKIQSTVDIISAVSGDQTGQRFSTSTQCRSVSLSLK